MFHSGLFACWAVNEPVPKPHVLTSCLGLLLVLTASFLVLLGAETTMGLSVQKKGKGEETGVFACGVIWPGLHRPLHGTHRCASQHRFGECSLIVLSLSSSGRTVGQTTVPVASLGHNWCSWFPFLTVYFKFHSRSSRISAGLCDLPGGVTQTFLSAVSELLRPMLLHVPIHSYNWASLESTRIIWVP